MIIIMLLNSFIKVLENTERSITGKHWRKKKRRRMMIMFIYLHAYSTAQRSVKVSSSKEGKKNIYTQRQNNATLII
jgi:hypothetical protein